jgi:hypothetical protein
MLDPDRTSEENEYILKNYNDQEGGKRRRAKNKELKEIERKE